MQTTTTYAMVPFTPAHLTPFLHAGREALLGLPALTPQAVAGQPVTGYTLLGDGEPLAAGGLIMPYPGLGIGWIFTRQVPEPQGLRVALALRSGFRRLARQGNYRRIEALVLKDFPTAHRVAFLLGFEPCCLKDGYGPGGEAMVEYVWRPR